ncbi:response regulator [Ferruginibacter sp. HRS2-29]|uniref:response regulator n=1 Tax=Ferruginibacter sp. HRS2-29 TaxID=2487334 RepID=UPI0020CCA004|nr:response regulator [Ferruginibacter sp. HRS2-29]MCP9753335.1 response regulator [Ferruginibacter sp. HRS2-29]
MTIHHISPTSPNKILIVDDEGDICYLLKNALKGSPYEPDHVNTLAQAEIFMKEEKPAVLFLDNRLPDGWGINSIKNIKAQYPSMKIIIITGDSSSNDKKRALENGASLFIQKPFTKQEILEAVEKVQKV